MRLMPLAAALLIGSVVMAGSFVGGAYFWRASGGKSMAKAAASATPFVLTPEERNRRDDAAAQAIFKKAVADVGPKGILTGSAFFTMPFPEKSDNLFAIHNALLPDPQDEAVSMPVLSSLSGKPIGKYDRKNGLTLY